MHCLHLYNSGEAFQVGVELMYSLSLLPTTEGYETVVLPHFEKEYPDDCAVEDFLSYFETNLLWSETFK